MLAQKIGVKNNFCFPGFLTQQPFQLLNQQLCEKMHTSLHGYLIIYCTHFYPGSKKYAKDKREYCKSAAKLCCLSLNPTFIP